MGPRRRRQFLPAQAPLVTHAGQCSLTPFPPGSIQEDHRHEENVPAEQSAPQADPRLSRPHAHEGRSRGPFGPPSQGPQAPLPLVLEFDTCAVATRPPAGGRALAPEGGIPRGLSGPCLGEWSCRLASTRRTSRGRLRRIPLTWAGSHSGRLIGFGAQQSSSAFSPRDGGGRPRTSSSTCPGMEEREPGSD